MTLDADAVSKVASSIDILQTMRELFVELGQGLAVQPPQSVTLFPQDKGDFITYQGVLADAGVFGAKLSPYLVTEDKPVITAWTLLMSMATGQPLLLCDSGQLTTERTAATTALAVDFLSGKDASKIAIIGSGAVAQAHWRHTSALRDWRDVTVYSPSLQANPARQQEWLSLCPQAQFASTAEEAANDADTVLLCTSSGTPVLDHAVLAPHTLVTSISTNVAQAHEIAPEFLLSAQVYCDYRATTPQSAGDMVLAAQDHGWSDDAILGDLGQLATGTCERPQHGQPIFFRSIGLGLEDIAVANAIYTAARQ